MVPLEYSYKFDAFILYTSDCLAQSQVCMCAFYFLSGHHCAVRIPLGVFWLQHRCFLNLSLSVGQAPWLVLMLMAWLVLREFNYPEIMLVSVWLLYVRCPYDYVHVWRHFMLPTCPAVASSEVFLAPTPHSNSYCISSRHSSWIWNTYWICVL